jgi:hypothetical protein
MGHKSYNGPHMAFKMHYIQDEIQPTLKTNMAYFLIYNYTV